MSLNYSKFDRIVDSDDEDDGDDVRTGGGRPPAAIDQITRQMPPHLYRKLTEAQMAASSGDHVAALRAQQELSAELERGPPEFKAAFMRAQALHDSGAAAQALASRPGPAPVAASSSSTKPTSQMTRQEVQATLRMAQAKQTATLKHLEQVEKLAGEDPAEMMKFMDGLGLTPEMVEAAERSDDPDAMRKLAEKMVAATMGGAEDAEGDEALRRAGEMSVALEQAATGGLSAMAPAVDVGGGGGGGGASEAAAAAAVAADPKLFEIQQQLEAKKAKMRELQEDLEKSVQAAQHALAGKERAALELQEAERRKQEQGDKVDESIEGARATVAHALQEKREGEGRVLSLANDVRERGNAAMRKGDLAAARGFYTEALSLADADVAFPLPAAEAAKLHANRCACLLAMNLQLEALCDARQAAALAPGWPKAAYRLGGVLHALGRRRGAAAALRRAARLADEQGEAGEIGAEIGARLRSVEQELEEEQEASAARRAEAGRRAAGGDWEGARAAYTELIDGAVAAAAEEREEQREEDDEDEGGEEPGGGGGGGAADGPEPALYANRAACMLRLGRLHECVADCDAALIPRVGGVRAASADGGVPDRLRWKLLLRRAEAHKGLGRPAQAARDLDAAARLPHDADAAKVLEHMRADLHDAAL